MSAKGKENEPENRVVSGCWYFSIYNINCYKNEVAAFEKIYQTPLLSDICLTQDRQLRSNDLDMALATQMQSLDDIFWPNLSRVLTRRNPTLLLRLPGSLLLRL